MKDLKSLFPRASASTIAANPHLVAGTSHKTIPGAILTPTNTSRRGAMNKTETEFSFMLEAQKRKGDILRWEFEGITLRFASVQYTPDFVLFPSPLVVSSRIKFIEVKGNYIKGHFERAVERFRHARTYWPEFIFELHQKTRDGWRQII